MKSPSWCKYIFTLIGYFFFFGINAQDSGEISLEDLDAFDDPGKNWQIVGRVDASLEAQREINISGGTGILVNNPRGSGAEEELFTKLHHGDMDLSLDYMVPKGSNSGIYLQGRYEIQILDSWTVKNPTSGDNGGIYERWDESKPEGEKGYQGYPPRQNASRAPGLWQHLEISFRAPRFDDKGNKIENAIIQKVTLNGVTIHEDVELSGPTRGHTGEGEVARAPIRIQGDHGPVAFRNINITRYDKTAPELANMSYEIYEGEFKEMPDPDTLSVKSSGNSKILTANLSGMPGQFLLHYQGTIKNREAGEYHLDLNTPGGSGQLTVGQKEVIEFQGKNQGKVNLPAGDVPFEMYYAKGVEWVDPNLALSVSADGLRKKLLSDKNVGNQNPVNPIYVTARDKPLLRSFRDLPGGHRVTHGISVSSLDKIHYTYDMDFGTLVQVWRGNFLNATPMWHRRGDGSSRPNGSVETLLKDPALTLAKLANEQSQWPADTAGSGFQPQGYSLEEGDNPVFKYQLYNTQVEDKIRVLDHGKGLERNLTLENPGQGLYTRLATGSSIRKLNNDLYLIDDQSYYLRIEEEGNANPIIRTRGDQQELIIPAAEKLHYTILF